MVKYGYTLTRENVCSTTVIATMIALKIVEDYPPEMLLYAIISDESVAILVQRERAALAWMRYECHISESAYNEYRYLLEEAHLART